MLANSISTTGGRFDHEVMSISDVMMLGEYAMKERIATIMLTAGDRALADRVLSAPVSLDTAYLFEACVEAMGSQYDYITSLIEVLRTKTGKEPDDWKLAHATADDKYRAIVYAMHGDNRI